MRIIDPSVEIITESHPLRRIELCGRVCYKSEARISSLSAGPFVERLIESGHTSVLEHARIIVPDSLLLEMGARRECPCSPPYGYWARSRRAKGGGIAMNARDFLATQGKIDELRLCENASDYMTARFICDRAIANELVRHRVFSFSQESTRYVNYKDGADFIRPVPFEWSVRTKATPEDFDPRWHAWYSAMEQSENCYLRLVHQGCTPQEARSVLPLSTKTELVMTGTHEQWEGMLKLRLDRAAHPQMRHLMKMLVTRPDFPAEIAVPEYEK